MQNPRIRRLAQRRRLISKAQPAELERIGFHLRQVRMDCGWTLGFVAQKAGIHIAELSKVEAGRRLPTISQTINLARVLGIPIQKLLSGEVRTGEGLEETALELRHFGILDLL